MDRVEKLIERMVADPEAVDRELLAVPLLREFGRGAPLELPSATVIKL